MGRALRAWGALRRVRSTGAGVIVALCAHIQAGVVLAEHVVGAQHQLVADLAEVTRRMTLGQLVAVDTTRLTVGQRIDGLGALRPGVLRGLDAVIEERVAHKAAEGPSLLQQIAAQCPSAPTWPSRRTWCR